MRVILVVLGLCWVIPPVYAVSFDCTKAASTVEKKICSDSLLGKLDDALSANFQTMLAANIGSGAKKDLKATQKKWLQERNRCQSNQCLADSYKKRIDEICDYPVISGVYPDCHSAEEVVVDLGGLNQNESVSQVGKAATASIESPKKLVANNLEKVKQLKLSEKFSNSVIYVNYLGQWVDYMPVLQWVGLLFDNKKIESIQSISAGSYPGISIKRPGRPAIGVLFRIEGKEAYIYALVTGDEVHLVETAADHSQMAIFVKSLTSADAMD